MAIRFTTILKDLIIEGSRFSVLFDKFVKPKERGSKGLVPFETLVAIIAADPTSKFPEGKDIDELKPEDMENVKIGKYVQWLLKNFVTPKLSGDHPLMISDPKSGQYKEALKAFQSLYLEDLYKTTTNLKKYERFKNKLSQEYRDINKLTIETLYDNVKDFSLEKTKATADEKKTASITYDHPGGEVVYRGGSWTVIKISNTGQLGKDAACFYGGSHNEARKGETNWCTSSPGLNWFERYINKGPLYVVIPNTPATFKNYGKEIGDVSGLPANRYQFHFPDSQFMDADDRQIDLIEFLNKQEPSLKDFFKPEFMKSLSNSDGTKVSVTYPNDSSSKFIALYGFDEFFETLPNGIKRLEFVNKSTNNLSLNVPDTLGRFKDLTAIHFVNCVKTLPNTICNLTQLQFLSLPDNKELNSLPECLVNLNRLCVINLVGSNPKLIIPEKLKQKMESDETFFFNN